MQMSGWQVLRSAVHLYWVGVRRRMVIGARLMLIQNGKVLLVKHGYQPGWHFPGGGVEPGETARDSAIREGEEETGYRVRGDVRLLGFYFKQNAATDRDHVAVYVATAADLVRSFQPNAEIAAIGWFAPEHLPSEIEDGTARRIREQFEGLEPSDRW